MPLSTASVGINPDEFLVRFKTNFTYDVLWHNSSTVNHYIQAVRDQTCELLELIAEGLYVKDKSVFSGLFRDVESDSLLRLNYYLPTSKDDDIGFWEHSDAQLLSMLTSNDVAGLQILVEKDAWISVPAEPNAFWVIVGDMLQVETLFLYLDHLKCNFWSSCFLFNQKKCALMLIFICEGSNRRKICERPAQGINKYIQA